MIPLELPPLRERPDDVVALARCFVTRHAPRGAQVVLSPEAVEALLAHAWPGNVRELQNVIERALAFEPTPRVLTPERLALEVA